MKIRTDFVTNSSSSSFIITNKTDKDKTLVDFVNENSYLLEDFKNEYGYEDSKRFVDSNMTYDAHKREEIFPANSKGVYAYGDEDGDTLGWVYDYILRDGGESDSFKWEFYEYNR